MASKIQELSNKLFLQICRGLYELLMILSAQIIAVHENTSDLYKFSLCYTLDCCEISCVIQWTADLQLFYNE